jgi:hypothetical protein
LNSFYIKLVLLKKIRKMVIRAVCNYCASGKRFHGINAHVFARFQSALFDFVIVILADHFPDALHVTGKGGLGERGLQEVGHGD